MKRPEKDVVKGQIRWGGAVGGGGGVREGGRTLGEVVGGQRSWIHQRRCRDQT